MQGKPQQKNAKYPAKAKYPNQNKTFNSQDWYGQSAPIQTPQSTNNINNNTNRRHGNQQSSQQYSNVNSSHNTLWDNIPLSRTTSNNNAGSSSRMGFPPIVPSQSSIGNNFPSSSNREGNIHSQFQHISAATPNPGALSAPRKGSSANQGSYHSRNNPASNRSKDINSTSNQNRNKIFYKKPPESQSIPTTPMKINNPSNFMGGGNGGGLLGEQPSNQQGIAVPKNIVSAASQMLTPQQQQQLFMSLQNSASESGFDPYSILANTLQKYSMVDPTNQKVTTALGQNFMGQRDHFQMNNPQMRMQAQQQQQQQMHPNQFQYYQTSQMINQEDLQFGNTAEQISRQKFKLRNPEGFKFEYSRFDPVKPRTPEESDMGYSHDDCYKIDIQSMLGLDYDGPLTHSSFYEDSQEGKGGSQDGAESPLIEEGRLKKGLDEEAISGSKSFIPPERMEEIEIFSKMSMRQGDNLRSEGIMVAKMDIFLRNIRIMEQKSKEGSKEENIGVRNLEDIEVRSEHLGFLEDKDEGLGSRGKKSNLKSSSASSGGSDPLDKAEDYVSCPEIEEMHQQQQQLQQQQNQQQQEQHQQGQPNDHQAQQAGFHQQQYQEYNNNNNSQNPGATMGQGYGQQQQQDVGGGQNMMNSAQQGYPDYYQQQPQHQQQGLPSHNPALHHQDPSGNYGGAMGNDQYYPQYQQQQGNLEPPIDKVNPNTPQKYNPPELNNAPATPHPQNNELVAANQNQYQGQRIDQGYQGVQETLPLQNQQQQQQQQQQQYGQQEQQNYPWPQNHQQQPQLQNQYQQYYQEAGYPPQQPQIPPSIDTIDPQAQIQAQQPVPSPVPALVPGPQPLPQQQPLQQLAQQQQQQQQYSFPQHQDFIPVQDPQLQQPLPQPQQQYDYQNPAPYGYPPQQQQQYDYQPPYNAPPNTTPQNQQQQQQQQHSILNHQNPPAQTSPSGQLKGMDIYQAQANQYYNDQENDTDSYDFDENKREQQKRRLMFDDSRNSEQRKQELKRKRKRPNKQRKKRIMQKDINDQNMIDNISEISIQADSRLHQNSEFAHGRKRGSSPSISAISRSAPDRIITSVSCQYAHFEFLNCKKDRHQESAGGGQGAKGRSQSQPRVLDSLRKGVSNDVRVGRQKGKARMQGNEGNSSNVAKPSPNGFYREKNLRKTVPVDKRQQQQLPVQKESRKQRNFNKQQNQQQLPEPPQQIQQQPQQPQQQIQRQEQGQIVGNTLPPQNPNGTQPGQQQQKQLPVQPGYYPEQQGVVGGPLPPHVQQVAAPGQEQVYYAPQDPHAYGYNNYPAHQYGGVPQQHPHYQQPPQYYDYQSQSYQNYPQHYNTGVDTNAYYGGYGYGNGPPVAHPYGEPQQPYGHQYQYAPPAHPQTQQQSLQQPLQQSQQQQPLLGVQVGGNQALQQPPYQQEGFQTVQPLPNLSNAALTTPLIPVATPPNQNHQEEEDDEEKNQLTQQSEALKEILSDSQNTVLQQSMHKVLTGKLQRVIRDGNMSDKLKIFKILKPDMLKICCDPYGKYVANLFVTFNIPAIGDSLISFFDKNMFELSRNRYAAKFCQKIIEFKFKDKRLKRSLVKLVNNLEHFLAEKTSATLVTTLVNLSSAQDLVPLAEYCKENSMKCLEIEPMARIMAKIIKKVNPGIASELIVFSRQTCIGLVRLQKGKEFVQIYLEKGSPEDRQFLLNEVLRKPEELLTQEPSQYIFSKFAELEMKTAIDKVLEGVIRGSDLRSFEKLVNQYVGSRNLQMLFLTASKSVKVSFKIYLESIVNQYQAKFTQTGQELWELVGRYFQTQL